ncbi:LysR substrate-binding domain-containing protein [Aureimonas sp. SK2]|uniref:LysR substrate-binding domain-containing protein n=1 Tax=Aureimonas sp. SK2 TaxID=3015992 RepID=UPI0024437DF5|nr:LysR substrate-binding domain-containing protein [Aureimonas sp. SK2]
MVGAPLNLDMDVLRTFVTGMDLGSFAKAAERLGRSPSAISLHLRKLEGQLGQPLVRRHGRGLVPTEAGEVLMAYARRILDLNDEARLALGGLGALDGWVRVGVPQDFAETWLPQLLARFQRAYPKVRVEARVDRGSCLADAVASGTLDLALTWGALGRPDGEIVADMRLAWIAGTEHHPIDGEPVALVAFDGACAFRHRATAALDAAGMPWRQVFATSSLSGVWAAVRAGLGLTARTAGLIPSDLCEIDPSGAGLPALGSIELVLHSAPSATPATGVFRELLLEAVGTGAA